MMSSQLFSAEFRSIKNMWRAQKTTVVDDRRISLVKENLFSAVGQIQNRLQEVGVRSESLSPDGNQWYSESQKQEEQIRVC